MKKIVLSFTFTVLTILTNSNAFAVDYAFYSLNSKPAGFNDGGTVKGYYADILKRLGAELGVADPKVNLGPYPRVLKALNDNANGIVITILFPSGRFSEKVNQPADVGHFETGIISMKNAPVNWDNIAGKRISTVKGASKVYGDKFHTMTEDGTIKLGSVTDYNQAIKMLSVGRIDGFAGSLGPILNDVKGRGLDIAPPAVITNKISKITISVAPGTPDGAALVSKIGQIVDGMRASGEIQGIIEGYLPEAKQPR